MAVLHSKVNFRDLVFVSEVYREDGTLIWKKSRDENKWLWVVTAVEFSDGDCIEEMYSLHRVELKETNWETRRRFVPEEKKYPVWFIYKVEDVIYSFDNNCFKFLCESRNSIRRTNPDKSLSRYFRDRYSKEELVKLLDSYKNRFKH